MQQRQQIVMRLLASVGIGLLAGYLCYTYQVWSGRQAGDLSFGLAGARQLLSGMNPYSMIDLPGDLPLFYPVTTFILVIPFLAFTPEVAAGIFFGASSALVAWFLSGEGWHRLLFFTAFPYWQSLQVVQWSPLLCCIWFAPYLLFLVSAKPNVGIVFLSSTRWDRRGYIGILLIGGISLIVQPSWPFAWLNVIRQHPSEIPALSVPGFLLLLALLRWREPAARLLLALSVVPQRLFYDQLPLFLIPRTWKPALLLSIGSWVSYCCWFFFPQGQMIWVVLGQFFPALIIVLLPSFQQWRKRLVAQ